MNNGHILLVEDNPDDVKLTIQAFRKQNVANPVKVAIDGQQALDCLFDEGEKLPALVLLDLKLPKATGFDVLKRLRADPVRKRLPVVILTSSTEESALAESYALGANSFIRKPVNFDQFSDAVRKLGQYWLLLNEPPPLSVPAAT